MNVENLKKVRDAIAQNPTTYDQRWYAHECGTPACIAGWAASLSLRDGETLNWGGIKRPDGRYANPHTRAQQWLGLSPHDAGRMFDEHPVLSGGEFRVDPTVQEALAMLDRAIETGKVVWEERHR